ncbi:hypothetical protein [Streptomyces sp. Ac-502]|uniref:hypothetical protein n=1 Tax=Streptomyces sp. Ac-502 TaxID=3342801 RepID=UPI0038622D41
MSTPPQSMSLTLDTPEGFHELPLHLPRTSSTPPCGSWRRRSGRAVRSSSARPPPSPTPN